MSKAAYLIGISRYQLKTMFSIVLHFSVSFTHPECDQRRNWLQIRTLWLKQYPGTETWDHSTRILTINGYWCHNVAWLAFPTFWLQKDRELFEHEKSCWIEAMTFLIIGQVFFNDLHPNEPVQRSYLHLRESNAKAFSSSASRPRGRATVAEQRLAD